MFYQFLILFGLLLIISQILKKFSRRKFVEYIMITNEVTASGHHFVTMLEDEHAKYCSLCENSVKSGIECDYCGVIVDSMICLRSLSSIFSCKVNVSHKNGRLQHHWVFGNLPSSSMCISCSEMCGDGVGLVDYRCSLCQITVHSDCRKRIKNECDMGQVKNFIVPPNCLSYRKAGFGRKKQLVIDSLRPPQLAITEQWTPLFVFVNTKSGGAEGSAVLRAFRLILHPVQVINIEQSRVGVSLRWMESHPSIKCYGLIAGGDGTVSLILDAILELNRRPAIAILPLGTGNDLSRTLGWGSGHSGPIDILQILKSLKESEVKMLDRWSVNIIHKRRFGVRAKNKHMTMVNYISVGVDACVTYGMQSTRDSFRRILSSRFLNKLLFFTYGTKDVLEHACANLHKKIELTVDDNVVSLPDIEGLTIINIPNWGAGVKPWGFGDDMIQAIDDGMFEVFGVKSSFHIAQMQVGLATGLRITQGKKLKIRLFGEPLPMQCDGEAWIQYPGSIQIEIKDQAIMLSLENSSSYFTGFYC